MSKEAAVQSAKDQIKAAEVAIPAVEKSEPVIAQATAPEPKEQVATFLLTSKTFTIPPSP